MAFPPYSETGTEESITQCPEAINGCRFINHNASHTADTEEEHGEELGRMRRSCSCVLVEHYSCSFRNVSDLLLNVPRIYRKPTFTQKCFNQHRTLTPAVDTVAYGYSLA